MTHAAKKFPPVVVVDENDHEIGSAMLAEVWQKGLHHRGVSIFILDNNGRMLLQCRSSQAGIYPNCWDQAAGGHVDEGSSYDQTAVNELAEEAGLHNIPLKTLGTFRTHNELPDGRIVNEFERVYEARVSHDVALKPEPEEVSELKWFTPTELKASIAQHPETFTPGLLYDLKRYYPDFLL
jgi:isopentenyl-diphosphate delta-isomerase